MCQGRGQVRPPAERERPGRWPWPAFLVVRRRQSDISFFSAGPLKLAPSPGELAMSAEQGQGRTELPGLPRAAGPAGRVLSKGHPDSGFGRSGWTQASGRAWSAERISQASRVASSVPATKTRPVSPSLGPGRPGHPRRPPPTPPQVWGHPAQGPGKPQVCFLAPSEPADPALGLLRHRKCASVAWPPSFHLLEFVTKGKSPTGQTERAASSDVCANSILVLPGPF